MDAVAIIKQINPRALIAEENGLVCMVEDVGTLPDMLYRIEIQSTPDGSRAIAYARHVPGPVPNDARMQADGLIDLGAGSDQIETSPVSLRIAITKARFWCLAHQHWLSHRNFLQENRHDHQAVH